MPGRQAVLLGATHMERSRAGTDGGTFPPREPELSCTSAPPRARGSKRSDRRPLPAGTASSGRMITCVVNAPLIWKDGTLGRDLAGLLRATVGVRSGRATQHRPRIRGRGGGPAWPDARRARATGGDPGARPGDHRGPANSSRCSSRSSSWSPARTVGYEALTRFRRRPPPRPLVRGRRDGGHRGPAWRSPR
jgi:hypothetical protein